MSERRDSAPDTQTPDGGDRPLADAQAHYDHDESHDLTTTIIVAVADAEGLDPIEIKTSPLYDYIDAVAVEEALFGPAYMRQRQDGTESITFGYRGHTVTVRSDDWVFVRSADEE
jgi:hypothetical protein